MTYEILDTGKKLLLNSIILLNLGTPVPSFAATCFARVIHTGSSPSVREAKLDTADYPGGTFLFESANFKIEEAEKYVTGYISDASKEGDPQEVSVSVARVGKKFGGFVLTKPLSNGSYAELRCE
jgi:hypothetical protein